ncbi:hypothetical protein SAMN05414139_05587 [Burkholderia sp. D7]|nr:hypothetical protein SAMN05414139_05587 [Burkholderia sp. D7]
MSPSVLENETGCVNVHSRLIAIDAPLLIA